MNPENLIANGYVKGTDGLFRKFLEFPSQRDHEKVWFKSTLIRYSDGTLRGSKAGWGDKED